MAVCYIAAGKLWLASLLSSAHSLVSLSIDGGGVLSEVGVAAAMDVFLDYRLIVLRDENLTSSALDATSCLVCRHFATNGSTLGLQKVLLHLAFTVHLNFLTLNCASDNLVESTILSSAASVASCHRPRGLMPVASSDIRRLQQYLVSTMLLDIDLVRHFLDAMLWNVRLLEDVLRRHHMLHITDKFIIVFGPVLLRLLKE